jgi:hypothetical protein
MIRQPSPRELAELCRGCGPHARKIILVAIQRGIRVSRSGNAWHFRAAGVDIIVANPKFMTERELDAVR